MKDVIIVDFDGTLYAKGEACPAVVDFIRSKQKTHDILVVTSRRYGNGIGQIQSFLYKNGIRPAAIFPGVGHDNPVLKSAVVRKIMQKGNIELALDNNPAVVLEYRSLGIEAKTPGEL